MKNKIPSEGLRLGRDSGSILCDTLKKWRFRTGWGGEYLIVNGEIKEFKTEYDELKDYKFFCFDGEPRFLYISDSPSHSLAFLNTDW